MELPEMKVIVDRYQQAREGRLAEQKKVDELHEKEKELANIILTALRDAASPVMGGTAYQCTRKVTNEPTAEDWDEVYRYIYEEKAWDLLHKRLSSAAVKARWDDGIEIPGVGAFPVEKLSLTKLPEGA